MKEQQKQKTDQVQLAALVARAKAGDQDAYTALYEATSQDAYRTVRAMVRSEETALDIQQDAYVFAFSHLDQLGEPAKFRTWLRSIVVNRTRSVLRRQTPVLFTELETEEGAGLPEIADLSPEASPELSLERQETADYIREILDSLTAGQRMLVGLYYYEQLPVGRIAEELGVTPGTVKTQLFRSRKKIEAAVKRLEEQGVKLCGLSPLPFLVALLKKQEPAAEAGSKVLAGALGKSGVLTETAALHVGRRFFETAAGKLVLGLIVAAAVGGGIAGYHWYQSHARPMGDYQPPSTWESTVETPENLTTETTEALPSPTDPESNEDLISVTTEPVETTEPTAPIGPADPAEPDPTDPSEKPTEPPPVPGVEPSAPTPSSEEPTDSTAPSEAPEPRFLRWYWLNNENLASMDLTDMLTPSNRFFLYVEVQGTIAPTVSIDAAGIIQFQYEGKEDSYDGIERYRWSVAYAGSGTVHLSCDFNGVRQGTLTICNPDHPAAYQSSNWSLWQASSAGGKTITDKLIGNHDQLWVYVQNADRPTVYTDDPSVLQISYEDAGSGAHWYDRHYRWNVKIVGCGTAHVYIEVAGTLAETYTVQVPEEPKSILRFQWVNENAANTYGVGSVNYIDMLVEGNEIPRVYSDRPDIVSLTTTGYSSGETGGRIQGYRIKAEMIAPGTANILCEYGGGIAYVFPVTVLAEP